jgi:hypothetical protein
MQIFLDAKSIISILRKGSRSPVEHSLALRVNSLLDKFNISLQYIWIKRAVNAASDYFTRVVDIDDYTISRRALIEALDFFSRPFPDIDLFATTANTKCQRFFSRFFQVGTAGVDTLHQNLNGLYALAFPPVAIITKFLQHLLRFKGVTILIIPIWTGASFWRLICPDNGHHPAGYVRQFFRLSARKPLAHISRGPIGNPGFLQQSASRHLWEWGAFVIDTTVAYPPLQKPPFCSLAHFGRKQECPVCSRHAF